MPVVTDSLQLVVQHTHALGGLDIDGILLFVGFGPIAGHKPEQADMIDQIGQRKVMPFVGIEVIETKAGEIADQDIAREIAVFQAGKVVCGLAEGAIQTFAARFMLDQQHAFPQQVDIAILAVDFLTQYSNAANRRRDTPKTLKKPSRKDLASASSAHSFAYSREKATARSLISCIDRDM